MSITASVNKQTPSLNIALLFWLLIKNQFIFTPLLLWVLMDPSVYLHTAVSLGVLINNQCVYTPFFFSLDETIVLFKHHPVTVSIESTSVLTYHSVLMSVYQQLVDLHTVVSLLILMKQPVYLYRQCYYDY